MASKERRGLVIRKKGLKVRGEAEQSSSRLKKKAETKERLWKRPFSGLVTQPSW